MYLTPIDEDRRTEVTEVGRIQFCIAILCRSRPS
jgi:hypothetical protein